MWFGTIFDPRANLEKSELILVESVKNANELRQEYGCKIEVLHSLYPCFPLGAPFRPVIVRAGVEERLHGKLALWKSRIIPRAGGFF